MGDESDHGTCRVCKWEARTYPCNGCNNRMPRGASRSFGAGYCTTCWKAWLSKPPMSVTLFVSHSDEEGLLDVSCRSMSGKVFAKKGLSRRAVWQFKELLHDSCNTTFRQAPNGCFYRQKEFIEWYSRLGSHQEFETLQREWKRGLCIHVRPIRLLRPDGRTITSDSTSLFELACEECRARRLQIAMGTHPRLGADSALRLLAGKDLLRQIVFMVERFI
eukprot:TRINITY_DN41211_c0_g1_i1.p1 TRINITY_DN41211_c0_g1~~TRINITY_DN41211_c0_g1_i1.p1  ORF type:complete len:219 (-),score=32.58 TRINITY_DN41211_c0_g1_i1:33-689(-)